MRRCNCGRTDAKTEFATNNKCKFCWEEQFKWNKKKNEKRKGGQKCNERRRRKKRCNSL